MLALDPHATDFMSLREGIKAPFHMPEATCGVVVGEREGVTFTPPKALLEAVRTAKIIELHDIWTKGKFDTASTAARTTRR